MRLMYEVSIITRRDAAWFNLEWTRIHLHCNVCCLMNPEIDQLAASEITKLSRLMPLQKPANFSSLVANKYWKKTVVYHATAAQLLVNVAWRNAFHIKFHYFPYLAIRPVECRVEWQTCFVLLCARVQKVYLRVGKRFCGILTKKTYLTMCPRATVMWTVTMVSWNFRMCAELLTLRNHGWSYYLSAA
jgi:hypothetical protein